MTSCLRKLEEVEQHLDLMESKYERQRGSLNVILKASIGDRAKCLHLLRRRRIIDYYIKACHEKASALYSKKMAVEQIAINNSQLQALKQVTKVFESNRVNIEKIEALEESMQNMYEHLLEVDDVLTVPAIDIDDNDLMEELHTLSTESSIVNMPEVPRDFPPKIPTTSKTHHSNAELEPLIGE